MPSFRENLQRVLFDTGFTIMRKVHKFLSDKLYIESQLVREVLAEFVATTFFLGVGFGCTFTRRLSRETAGDFVTENIGWGLALVFGVITAGGVSGGHVNPSLSLAFALIGHLPWIKVPLYMLAQLLGAFTASSIAYGIYYDALNAYDGGIRIVTGANATAGLFATYPQDFLTTGSALANEVFATAILMFCVMAINDEKNMSIPVFLMPLFAGLAFLLINCSLCFNNGCAMNPARDLAPRFFTLIAGWGPEVFSFRNYNWFWVPIFGPFCGAPLGALTYIFTIGRHFPQEEPAPADVSSLQMRSTSMDEDLDQTDIHPPSIISRKALVPLKSLRRVVEQQQQKPVYKFDQ